MFLPEVIMNKLVLFSLLIAGSLISDINAASKKRKRPDNDVSEEEKPAKQYKPYIPTHRYNLNDGEGSWARGVEEFPENFRSPTAETVTTAVAQESKAAKPESKDEKKKADGKDAEQIDEDAQFALLLAEQEAAQQAQDQQEADDASLATAMELEQENARTPAVNTTGAGAPTNSNGSGNAAAATSARSGFLAGLLRRLGGQ